ncbi:4-hydroxybenzoate nonaprenyltransferase [Heterostelium album PN500]|uniref:4-hydroxybenzoate polyprenyltransferase, mitochondrial n=1 Tax=Heterostelium pallidum (strain ATCC 26659 / Pp 5 / PN500) TaxID=670386 RepID=D3BQE1_HETP5|nr:4-hydroxybenzoate nonaprenyltransferase [Heterostelium album PN500]EFA76361.1 4-hydroxybenzoate nonaprenyltransferase [Heterostelium album PN500]|eukprot:XP_020428493.1 4-hydroxybenzoate nonaprenyltransferase [Heterostelium album PN500]
MKRATTTLFNVVPSSTSRLFTSNQSFNFINHGVLSSSSSRTSIRSYSMINNNNNNSNNNNTQSITIDLNINRSSSRSVNRLLNSKSCKSSSLVIPCRFNTTSTPSAPKDQSIDDNDSNANSLPIHTESWVDKAPARLQPYLRLSRLDKPIGTLLLLYPCLWSTAIAATPGQLPNFTLMMMFGAGAFLMRSAGCVINDMVDYKFDRKVDRTKLRPIASNQVTHKEALALLAGQLAISFGLLLNFNVYTILLSLASVPIVIIYPFMKRYTYYPQFVLGCAFNWGALVGYSAVQGYCDWKICLPLYVAGISWTMVYDTIYAHMDKKDDLSIGVKSTALAFGEKSRLILTGFSVATIAALNLAGLAAGLPTVYFVGTTIGAAHLAWQIGSVDFSSPKSCMKFFISNRTFALIILVTIILARLIEDDEYTTAEYEFELGPIKLKYSNTFIPAIKGNDNNNNNIVNNI